MKNLNGAGYRKNVDSGQRLPYIKIKWILIVINVIGHQKLYMKLSDFTLKIQQCMHYITTKLAKLCASGITAEKLLCSW